MKAEFDLKMPDGVRVRTLSQLLRHFDMDAVLEACRNGAFASWLASAGHTDRSVAVSRLDTSSPSARQELLAALELDPYTSARIMLGLANPAERGRRERRMREFTRDPLLWESLDCAALSQDDLDALSPLGFDQIFLCGDGQFLLPPDADGILYTGVGLPLVRFGPGPVAQGVDCEKVRFDTAGFFHDNLLSVSLENGADYYFPQFWNNPGLGVKMLEQAADEGDPKAQALLARCWMERYGTQDAEYLPSMPMLGVRGQIEPHFREWKDGSTQSHVQAALWSQRAAGQEDPIGMLMLAACCQSAWGVPEDATKATRLREQAHETIRAAAEAGDPPSQLNLAHILSSAATTHSDSEIREALDWTRRAAQAGLARAQCKLAESLARTEEGSSPDLASAFAWFRKAAQQGDAQGLARLGDFYYFGDVVEADLPRAVELYQKAASRGNLHAQERLAECLDCGFGVSQDRAAAAYWRSRVERQKERFAYKYGWSGKWERQESRAVQLRQFRLDEQGAREGNLDSLHALAWDYLRGVGVAPDVEKGLEHLHSAVEAGHVPAMQSLAHLCEKGEVVEKDVGQAMRLYEMAAEQGNLDAQATLARRYSTGKGVPKDPEKAAYWLMQAASQGSAPAQYELGLCYMHGNGVPVDGRRAAYWLAQAAEQGRDDAQYSLGAMLLNGETVESDPEAALHWFQAAAQRNNTDALFALGLMSNEGLGMERDSAQAARWYAAAAKEGHARSQCNLGAMYHKGEGVERNDQQAAYWYRKAAEQGHPRSQCNLARMYESGEGVERDLAEARRWYREAAEKGNLSAQCNLGCMYERGDGTPKNDAEAVRWFSQAAEQGHARSQYNLGCMYEGGRGVPRNKSEAVRWYLKAAEQGQPNAQLSLARCYRHGVGVMMSLKKAEYWKARAEEQGFTG